MRCVNEHFLEGCRFDEAFPNPCREEEKEEEAGQGEREPGAAAVSKLTQELQREGLDFSDEQQMKLRTIAARGGAGLLDVLLENTLISHGAAARAAVEPLLIRGPAAPAPSEVSTLQERIVIYLLVAMVLITVLITAAMIFVTLNWARARSATGAGSDEAAPEPEVKGPNMAERAACPPAISQYLSNQYHHKMQLQMQQLARPRQHQWRAHPVGGAAWPTGSGQAALAPAVCQSEALLQALDQPAGPAVASRYARGTIIVDSSAL